MATGTLFIDTNSLPREKAEGGEFAEILNGPLAGAKNVFGALRWIEPDDYCQAAHGQPTPQQQSTGRMPWKLFAESRPRWW